MIIPIWLQTAFKELGIHERRDRERVKEYLAVCGLGNREPINTPWCAAFIAWTLKESGMKYLESAHARDWLDYGMNIDQEWPRCGDLVILWRGAIDSTAGHVGFYIGRDNAHCYLLSGNQGDMVTIKPYDGTRILGARRPIVKRKVVAV